MCARNVSYREEFDGSVNTCEVVVALRFNCKNISHL